MQVLHINSKYKVIIQSATRWYSSYNFQDDCNLVMINSGLFVQQIVTLTRPTGSLYGSVLQYKYQQIYYCLSTNKLNGMKRHDYFNLNNILNLDNSLIWYGVVFVSLRLFSDHVLCFPTFITKFSLSQTDTEDT